MDVNFKPYKTGMVTGEYPKCCVFDLIRLRSVYPGGMDH